MNNNLFIILESGTVFADFYETTNQREYKLERMVEEVKQYMRNYALGSIKYSVVDFATNETLMNEVIRVEYFDTFARFAEVDN